MKKIRKIRKIKFGLRFKFTIVIIAAISFSSFLIGFAIYNQHEKKLNEDMMTLGSTILKGATSFASDYMRYENSIYEYYKTDEQDKNYLKYIIKKKNENLKSLLQYFPEMIKREKLLDISFLIKIDKEHKNKQEFIYFNRKKARIKYREKNDPHLKNSILRHYLSTIDTNPYLSFTKGRKEGEDEFIIVGIPLLKDPADSILYNEYLELNQKKLLNRKEILSLSSKEKYFRNEFLKRVIKSDLKFDYNITLDKDYTIKTIFYYIFRNYKFKKRNNEIFDIFKQTIEENKVENKISILNLKKITNDVINKNYLISSKDSNPKKFWSKFYSFLKRNNIRIETSLPTKQLAIKAYNSDLLGVLGMFLYRFLYHSEKEKYEIEIINLAINIFLRCIFLAFFFPTFIIRKVSSLAKGAKNIGRGHFDNKIMIKGKDELGQLADIFNEMANDLNEAREVQLEKQRMESELITAQQIQNTLLPTNLPEIENIDFGAYYSSASESGGDYYDFIKISENEIGIAIADVSGHGVGSGLVMAMTRTLLHTYCEKIKNPKKIMEKINQYLYENTASNYFVSMFYGVLDVKNRQLSYSSAGHNQSILLRGGNLKLLPAEGIALGAVSNDTFLRMASVKTLNLNKNDYFIQYTDGIVEAMDIKNNEYGEERFYGALKDNIGEDPEKLITSIIESVSRFTGDITQNDDITMIALKIK